MSLWRWFTVQVATALIGSLSLQMAAGKLLVIISCSLSWYISVKLYFTLRGHHWVYLVDIAKVYCYLKINFIIPKNLKLLAIRMK